MFKKILTFCFVIMAGSFFYQAFTDRGGWSGAVEVIARGFILIIVSVTFWYCFFKGSNK